MGGGEEEEEESELFLFATDLEFVKTFLFTYQAFTTPEKLLKKLIERYNVVCPEGMSLKEFDVMRQTIQARVINALRLWVDLSVDFKGTQFSCAWSSTSCLSLPPQTIPHCRMLC